MSRTIPNRRARPAARAAALLAALALTAGLAACGKKPGSVDPPAGTDYPNSSMPHMDMPLVGPDKEK